MTPASFDDLYANAPETQRETLRAFRASHPVQHVDIDGVRWEYIASGQGEKALLILGGGLSVTETSFRHILRLEQHYRVISPSYPPVGKMPPIASGLAGLVAREGFAKAHVFGHSLGSAVGHVLVRLRPDCVDKLVLDAFGLYTKGHVLAARLFLMLPFALLKAYYRRALRRLMATTKDDDARFFALYMDEVMDRLHTRETLLGQFKLLLDVFDHAAEYGTFRPVDRPGQVLLMLAEDDRGFSPQERQSLIDTYPGAKQHTFASGGHLAGFSRQAEFDAVLDGFLGR